jgi:dUTP pyrophosphatase
VFNIKLVADQYRPTRGTAGDAGFDLRARLSAPITLQPGQRALIPTGVFMEIPIGWVGLIWPRSGTAVKQGIDRMAGCIDPIYRGEIHALLINKGPDEMIFNDRDRIAQLLIMPCYAGELYQVDELSETVRGDGGFGHTGIS